MLKSNVFRALVAGCLGGSALLSQSTAAPPMPPAGQPVPLTGLARTHTPEPTTAAIDVRDLMTRAYIIADDSMEGRDTGRPGGVKSTNYIAGELKRLGLQPAGENGTYFQAVPFARRRIDSTSVLRTGTRELHQFTDFLVVSRIGLQVFLGGQPFGGQFRGTNIPVVAGGRIGDATMLAPADARGKIVVFTTSTQSAGQFPRWQFWRGGDNLARYSGAKAIIIEVGDTLPAAPQLRNAGGLFYTDSSVLSLPIVVTTSVAVRQLFGGVEARVGDVGTPVSGHFGYVDAPTESPTRNVVAILPGSDPLLRNQYVVVSAHADHVGYSPQGALDHDSVRVFNSVARPRGADDPQPRNVSQAQWQRINGMLDSIRKIRAPRLDSIANGADDDGSGTVLTLEIAEAYALARQHPKRSLLFVWHAAEEKGLYGAQYFADHPSVPRDSIVAAVNMDQMGRGGPEDAPPGGTDALVVLGVRRLSTELGVTAERVNQRPGYGFKFDYSFDQPNEPSNGWCRSDHYMYARYNIPVLFFVSAVWYIDYHMVSDEPQYLAYPRMAKIGNYIKDVVGELANQAKRPVVDGPRLDPFGLCRQ